MQVFVTGGTGFVGQRLVATLNRRGHRVVALVRTYERARELPRGVRAVAGDLTKPESYRSRLADCDVMIHAASAMRLGPSASERERIERINVLGSRIAREAALAAGVLRVVHVSHAAAYGLGPGPAALEGQRPNPATALTFAAATRAQAQVEAMDAQAAGAPVIVVVPGQPFDPETPQPAEADFTVWRGERLWVLAGAAARRSWVTVSRLGEGLADVIERGLPGAVYHLGGEARPVRQIVEAGGPFRVWLPAPLVRAMARVWRDAWPAQAERWRAGADYVLDGARARVELGWAEQASF